MSEEQPPPCDFHDLLGAARAGSRAASDRMFELLHDELTRLASAVFQGQSPGHTLQPTALVHEAWVKLSGSVGTVNDKGHFLALAARAMRQVLADHARGKSRAKRGGSGHRVTLSTHLLAADRNGHELAELHDALEKLAAQNPKYAQIAELRVLGTLTLEEIARLMDISVSTASRDWQAVRLWLIREMNNHEP